MNQFAISVKLDRLFRRGRRLLGLSLLLSLLVHGLVLLILSIVPPQTVKPAQTRKAPVRLVITEKPRVPDPVQPRTPEKIRETQETKTIVEAPLPETEAPKVPAHLGAQDHATTQETKTNPQPSSKAADATPLQNGPLRLQVEEAPGGRIKVPKGKDYKEFLPKQIDVINPGHNDFVPDKKVPVGPMLDVNTTEYRFIGYMTAVRKLVDLAFYDIGPSLMGKTYIRDKVESAGKARLQGTSMVKLKVARSGLLVETKLVQSSGDKDVDEFWTRVLNLAAPYPPLPRDFEKEELEFTYQLHYDYVFEGERRKRRFMF